MSAWIKKRGGGSWLTAEPPLFICEEDSAHCSVDSLDEKPDGLRRPPPLVLENLDDDVNKTLTSEPGEEGAH